MGIFDKGFDSLKEIKKAPENVAKAAGDAAGAAGKATGGIIEKAGALRATGRKGPVLSLSNAANGIHKGASFFTDGANEQIGKSKDARKAKEKIFTSLESLQPVVNVVNDAAMALDNKDRTIKESAIPEVVAGALGAGVGGVGSFMALYGLGTVGLSAAGITSGLATAGAVVGGGMVAGVFVLAAPVAIAAGTGVAVASHLKNKQLGQEKERLYKEALAKHQAIIKALKEESDASTERLEYLRSLNVLLERAVNDLKSDLAIRDE